MQSSFYDIKGQAERRDQVYRQLIQFTRDRFDAQGRWLGEYAASAPEPLPRERLWFCGAFYAAGDSALRKRTDAIVLSTPPAAACPFLPIAALRLLLTCREHMSSKAADHLKGLLAAALDYIVAPSMDFVGVNDNFPCMCACSALLGGKLLGRPGVVEIGRRRLGHWLALLERRGVPTEYNSPTYSPIQVLAMAEIAEFSDADQELALKAEARLWLDVLGHYHPPTAQPAGPYSRAYMVDSCGHTHMVRSTLYALLGDAMVLHPINTLFKSADGEPGEVIHEGAPFMQSVAAWLAGVTYHCPEELVRRLLHRHYPFQFKATTEFGPSTDASPDRTPRPPAERQELYEYPAGSGRISTFMTEDYALGVASHEFHSGVQTDSFHVLYRRRAPVRAQADVGTVFARYVINNRRPGQSNHYPQISPDGAEQLADGGAGAVSADARAHHGRLCVDSLLWDEGRKLGLHHERSALMLYKPKLYARRGVSDMQLSLLFPAHHGRPVELWLGDRRVDAFPAESQKACPIFVKDGLVMMAFAPLLLTDHGRAAAVRADRVNGFLRVSFINYEGPVRDFSRGELLLTGNGFYAEVRSEAELAGGFPAFRRELGQLAISDELFACEHTRQAALRRVTVSKPGLRFECEYSPVTEGVKFQAINGRVPDAPRLEVTGVTA